MKLELDNLLENDIINLGKITEVYCDTKLIWKGLSESVSDLSNKYSFVKFDNTKSTGFNAPEYKIIVEEKNKCTECDHDCEFGVPEEKKFPLDTKEHVMSAIKFFNYVKPAYEDKLAAAIKSKMDKYSISQDHIGKDNRLAKYMTIQESKSTYYHTCPKCGANLDPGEKCDCDKADNKEKDEQKTEVSKDPKQVKGQLALKLDECIDNLLNSIK